MRFYIYLKGQWVEKKINLLSVQEDVKDETLDTASLNILADDRAEAYPSRTPCKIIEKGTTKYFYTGTDLVSAFSLTPLTYKHAISLVQTTRELSHHILPNMPLLHSSGLHNSEIPDHRKIFTGKSGRGRCR